MRCQDCRGQGRVVRDGQVIRPVYPGERCDGPVEPCPGCGGCGIASCCDGAVGGALEPARDPA